MESLDTYRQFLKADLWPEWRDSETDQRRGVPPPALQKAYSQDAVLIDLVPSEDLTVGKMPLIEAVRHRRSRRKFTGAGLSLEELSFLLWATQGISGTPSRDLAKLGGYATGDFTLRTVPSGGARHPFETYLFAKQVDGLEPGLYRYLPLEHRLCYLYADEQLDEKVNDACMSQWVKNSAAAFIWTAIPYRTEWRYSIVSPKIIAQDSGHMCQNLYLASEALGAGTCAIGAYDQHKMDALLGVDGKDEFTIYVAIVGRVT